MRLHWPAFITMGLLVIIPFAALAAFVIFRVARWLWRGGFGAEWRKVYGIFALAGALLGLWFVLFASYHVAAFHLVGFPIPIKIASRQNPGGAWTDAAIPAVIRAGAAVTDFLYGIVFCLVPVAIAAFIRENKGTRDFSGPHA
jgi:hypothetical protein